MSVPSFPAGRDLLEFSRDREDDVLLFTTPTRTWPTSGISERGLRPTTTHPDAIRPDLASLLNDLSSSLADLGRREDGLAAIEVAAQVYRELAAKWPDASYHRLEQSLRPADWLQHSESDASPVGTLRRDNGPLSGLPPRLGRWNALDDKGRPESADLCASSSYDGIVVSRP